MSIRIRWENSNFLPNKLDDIEVAYLAEILCNKTVSWVNTQIIKHDIELHPETGHYNTSCPIINAEDKYELH